MPSECWYGASVHRHIPASYLSCERSGEAASHQVHNLKNAGASPASATIFYASYRPHQASP